jgi:hypothetical protein
MSARQLTLLGFPNEIGSSVSLVVSAGTEPAGYEASYLKTQEPSDTARITQMDPTFTWWEADFSSAVRDFIGLATINSNLSPYGYYRYASSSSTFSSYAPSSMSSPTNRSGVLTDVDELISAPDGLFIGPTVTTSPWSSTFAFPTPVQSPPVGAANGLIVVNASMFGVPTSKYPKLTATLIQNGVTLSVLGWRAVTSLSNQTFIFDFNPSILTIASGALISVKLDFSFGSGTAYAKLDTLRLYTMGSSVSVHDSGYITSPYRSSILREKVITPTLSFHYFPAGVWSGLSNIELYIVDDQVQHDPPMGTSITGVPVTNVHTPLAQGYIEAGILVGGDSLTFTRGLTVSNPGSVGIRIEDVSGYTLGGQSYGASTFKRRRTGPLTIECTRDEADAFMRYVPWAKGHSGGFYLSLDPDISLSYQEFQSFWAVLVGEVERSEVPGAYAPDGTALFMLQCEFEEKL